MSDHAQTLLALGRAAVRQAEKLDGREAKKALIAEEACKAGADALVRVTQVCGNCAYRIDWPDAIGCNNGRGLGRDEVSPGDFCSQWAARKDDRP